MVDKVRRVAVWWYQRDWCIGLTVFLVALIPRSMPSGTFMDPDAAIFWIDRTRGFLEGISGGNPALLAPALHPGVTLMWLTSVGLGMWHVVEPFVTRDPVETFTWVLKLPLAFVTSGLAVVAWFYLRSFLGRVLAVTIAIVFALDPLYLVFSRYLHLDGLLTGFIMAGLLAAWSGVIRRRRRDVCIGGVLIALASLTRLNGIVAAVAAFGIIMFIGDASWRWRVRTTGIFLAAGMVTIIIVWPAVWAAPGTIHMLIQNRLGLALLPHEVPPTVDVVPWVRALLYPIFILTREWLVLVVAAIVGAIVSWRKTTANQLGRAMTVFIALWYVVLLAQPKDLDRYAVPMVGPLAIVAGIGLLAIWQKLRTRWLRWGMIAVIFVEMVLLYGYGPMYQLYQNISVPVLNASPLRTSQALTPAWGEGMREAVRFVQSQADHPPTMAAWYASVACYYGNPSDGNSYPLVSGKKFSCPPGMRLLNNPREADYLLLSRDQIAQRMYPGLIDDIVRLNWQPVHIVSIHGVDLIWIYRNSGGLQSQYTLTGR